MSLPGRSSDSGPEPSPFFTTDALLCESCGKPCNSVTWCETLEELVCSDCREESEALLYAEKTCQTLHDAIIRCKSIMEVRMAMRMHKAWCSGCGFRIVSRSPVNLPVAPPTKEAA